MFFSPSPLKSVQVSQMSPIDSFDYVSIESGRFCRSKFLWVDESGRWSSNFIDFTFLMTEGSFLNQDFPGWNRNVSIEYHLHCTQEFPCRYLDEFFIFLKETRFCRNTEEGHLAYSYPRKPCILFDVLALSLDPEILLMFCQDESGAKFEQY